MSTDELKPCPFCPDGGKTYSCSDEGIHYMGCDICGMKGPTSSSFNKALANWNTRTLEGLIEDMAEALEETDKQYWEVDEGFDEGHNTFCLDCHCLKWEEGITDPLWRRPHRSDCTHGPHLARVEALLVRARGELA